MEKTYFVTVHAVRLASSKFYEASKDLPYRALIECVALGQEDDEIILKVPTMLGLDEIVIREIVYDGGDTTSLDSRAFKSVADFKKANLYYAKHRLETQLRFSVDEATFDPVSDNYFERINLLKEAMEKFTIAYNEWHEHNHSKKN